MRTVAGSRGSISRPIRTFGRFLVFLAVYVQALLPFFVVADLRIAEFRIAAFPICHSDGSSTPGTADKGHATDCCPLCLALGAGGPFTAPPEPALPLPRDATSVAATRAASISSGYDTAVDYDARAPPLNS